MRVPRSSLAESTELRIRQAMFTVFFSASVFTMARFEEVSTSPGMLSLMRITPFGQAMMALVILTWVLLLSTVLGLSTGSMVTVRSGSTAASSLLMTPTRLSTRVTNSGIFLFFTASSPKASRGMAFRRLPPSKDERRTPSSQVVSARMRKKILLAFPRPKTMSMPEWPPFSPVMLSFTPP